MVVIEFLSQVAAVNLLAAYLVLMTFLSIVLLARTVRSGQARLSGLYAVSIIGWVDSLSLITGFSVGWILSIVNIVIGIILFGLIRAFRIPTAIATLISILLALSLRGTYIPAMYILYWVLAGCAFISIMAMINYGKKRTDEAFGLASLGLVACLAGIAFYFIPGTPLLSKWIAFGAAGIGGILTIFKIQYRVNVIEIVLACLLCFSIFLP